jgi:hypothetical protein
VKRTGLLALLLLGGCVSFNARAQVGPTADTGGRSGVSAMVMAGFGWTGDRSAAFWAAGAEQSGRVTYSADGVRVAGDEWGVRVGGHVVGPMEAASTEPTSVGFHTAVLYPLRARTRIVPDDAYDSSDKLLVKEMVHLFLGVETRAGIQVYEGMDDVPSEGELGAALSLELLYKFDDAM